MDKLEHQRRRWGVRRPLPPHDRWAQSQGGGLGPSSHGYVLVRPLGHLQYMSGGTFNPCEVCVSRLEET
jgi:hypothetical protein